jgi:hypothetical protein
MKIRTLLTTISAAALTAITINVSAGEALLTPREAGNQIKVIPGVTAAQPAFTTQAVSPRALGNQTITVASVANDVNPAIACRNMTGSPKAIQACAEHPATMPGCNPVTVAPLK